MTNSSFADTCITDPPDTAALGVPSATPPADAVHGLRQASLTEAPVDIWPAPGDEFTVVVEVRESAGALDGFVQNLPPKLSEMLRHHGGDDFCMAEEWFGQDFLPEQPGLYRMRLRVYVDPAYQIDDHEWSDEEPGLEVLTIERLPAAPL